MTLPSIDIFTSTNLWTAGQEYLNRWCDAQWTIITSELNYNKKTFIDLALRVALPAPFILVKSASYIVGIMHILLNSCHKPMNQKIFLVLGRESYLEDLPEKLPYQ